MLGKLIFLFAEYNLDSDIVDGSGPFESRILNMASPEIQKNLQQIQFSLVIITCKILFFFFSACCVDMFYILSAWDTCKYVYIILCMS